MLFMVAFSLGKNSAAALVHFGFFLALPVLLVSYGRRFTTAQAGVFAAMLVFASPLAGIDGSAAYNDIALATTAFGVFYLLQIWEESGDSRLLPLAGLLAGFCYALKYTGALVAPFTVAYVILRQIRTGKPWRMAGIITAGTAALCIAPWLIKNWVWMGNPLAPFYNSWFPNPNFSIIAEMQYKEYLQAMRDGSNRLKGLLDVTLAGRHSEGLLGPVFLLAPIALFSLRRPQGRRLLLMALILLPGYWSNSGGRFLLPALPFIASAMGLALANMTWALSALVVFHLIFSWYSMVPIYANQVSWRLRDTPLKAALRKIPEAEFMRPRQPEYEAARMLDELTPPGSMIFTADSVPQAYTARTVIVGYQSGVGRFLLDALWAPINIELQPKLRFRFPFFKQRVRGLRVVQVGPKNPTVWCVNEFRILLDGQEVQRRPGWRLRSTPNPWDVQRAFDNSYITKWCAGETARPGMMIEVTFGEPLMADEVDLEAQNGQFVQLQVEGLDEDGEWTPITGYEYKRAVVTELGNLRHAAMGEFSARGVRYLLVKDGSYGALDFWANAAAWGIVEIGERNGTRLYRID
jgi:hypothetical protein